MRDIEPFRQSDGRVWVGVVLAFLLIGLSLVILLSRISAGGVDKGLDPPAQHITLVAQKTGPQADAFPDRADPDRADPFDPIAYFAE